MSFFKDLVGVAKHAVDGFSKGGLGGAFKSVLGDVLQMGPVQNFLKGASGKVTDFLENSTIGKLINKVVPGLGDKVASFLDPARLAAMFGAAADPTQFDQVLTAAARNLPSLFA